MFQRVPEIQLKLDVINPRKVAHDAMRLVHYYYDEEQVRVKKMDVENDLLN